MNCWCKGVNPISRSVLVTETVAEEEREPMVAVIVPCPVCLPAVNNPSGLIVPSHPGETDQVMAGLGMALPNWPMTVAVNCLICMEYRESLEGESSRDIRTGT